MVSSPAMITANDLARFSIEAPRYTSYPTAAEFSSAIGAADYRAALADVGRSGSGVVSLYVHLPFCREICHFCGCHALIARTSDRIGRYLDALGREAAAVAEALAGNGREVGELHFGGGSPSLLSADDFERVMTDLRGSFTFAAAPVISLEADPRTTDLEKLRRYRQLGVRRLSFGFQDLDADVQRAIGRNQSREVARQAYDGARAVGFDGINIDLCYGLPEQTEATFAATVAEVAALRPDRIAIFGYAHVPWLKPLQRRIPQASLPTATLRLRLMADARATLVAAGYRAIGLDHFALPSDDLAQAAERGTLHRNFQGYTTTTTDTLIGLGLSAISDLPGGYFQNQRDLGAYQQATAAPGLATERGVRRSADDVMRGQIIRDLMCASRVDIRAVERRFGIDFAATFGAELGELRALVGDGLVQLDAAAIELTPLGTVFSRNIARVFDVYRRPPAKAAAAAPARRFSSSI
jgi:oxygen-independent coproporphyrinogen-3 oxidase